MIIENEIKLSVLQTYETFEDLLINLFGASKREIKKFILNKKILKKKIIARTEIRIPIDIINKKMICPVYEGLEIEVLYEDSKCIILNKSPGIHSHPLKYNEKDNCLSFLRQNNYFEALKVNEDNMDRGLLYRLDYGTSGVLVLLKDKKDYSRIRESFNKLVKEKCYLSIVEGDFKDDGEYTSFLRPSLKHGKKIVVSDHKEKKFLKETREGKIFIKKINYNSENKCSLLMIKLKTGLRHQIRAQLSHLGFPILGDELYGGSPSLRIFLHAFYYEIPIEDRKIIKGKAKKAYLFEKFFNLDSFFEVIKD